MKQLVIKENESGQRFDKYLAKYLKEAPKSFIYKMLRKKNITLNGKKADGSEKLSCGDEVKLFFADETLEKFRGNATEVSAEIAGVNTKDLDIVYEDKQVLFINKPVGMLSQKAQKEDISLVEYLTAYLLETGALTKSDLETFHPAVCNRLDRNTSGIVAAGKTLKALQLLSDMFKERTLDKYYLTLVKGHITKSSHVKGYLVKDEEKNKVYISDKKTADAQYIETGYEPLAVSAHGDTLLLVELFTGRSHQIRAHLASLGHPVIGDGKYGDGRVNRIFKEKYQVESQLLHAWKLVLPKMSGDFADLSEKELYAAMPKLFKKVCDGEKIKVPREGSK